MPNIKTYIVEDSAVIRENLSSVLQELVPIAVMGTAADEKTAVQWLTKRANELDLVIVDIFLKEGSGLGVLQAIRNISSNFSIVVLTNFATPEMNLKCIELGADRVFDKSNELADLVKYCADLAKGGSNSVVMPD